MRFSALIPVVVCAGALPVLAARPVATVELAGHELRFAPLVSCGGVGVAVVGPSYDLHKSFDGCQAGLVDLGEMLDGDYRFEVRLTLSGSSQNAPGTDAGGLSDAVFGSFAVRGGSPIRPSRGEPVGGTDSPGPSPNDFVINDDLIVEGHGCFSSDLTCADLEAFGSEDVKIKGGVPRLLFEDTNADPNANDDWYIETGPASVEELHIVHVDSGNQPFTIAAGAANNSIFVDAQGDVGFGTGTPNSLAQVDVFGDLHLTNATNGWRMYNNSNWFGVRNTAAGGDGQLVIAANAATYSLVATATGVGSGTLSPAAKLHMVSSDGTAQLRVEETSTTSVGRNMARFINNGAATFRFDNTSTGSGWGFGSRQAGDFFVSTIGSPTLQLNLTPAGNLVITGTLTQGSDRNSKDDVTAVDSLDVLARVSELPIATWRYKGDAATHVGPMAQDFHAAFGLGADDKHIAPADMAGLGLAAIQALRVEVADKDARIQALEERLAKLEAALQP